MHQYSQYAVSARHQSPHPSDGENVFRHALAVIVECSAISLVWAFDRPDLQRGLGHARSQKNALTEDRSATIQKVE